jgi:hypothetical protein
LAEPEVSDRGGDELLRKEVVELRASVAALNRKLLDMEAFLHKDPLSTRQQVRTLEVRPNMQVTVCPRWPFFACLQNVAPYLTSEGHQQFQFEVPSWLGPDRKMNIAVPPHNRL